MTEEFYPKLRQILDRNLSNTDFTIDELCRVLNMSQSSVYRKIHAISGKNPKLFLRWYRLNLAAKLLETGAGTIQEVAKKVGFGNNSYFGKCFKEQFSCSPSQLRDRRIQPARIDREFIREVNVVMEEHLLDPEFNVTVFATKLYMDRTTLYRKIRAIYGETPSRFIRSCRLKRAAQLLAANYGNVTQVAFEVGFISSSYFARCFEKMFHQLPACYRASGNHARHL